MAKKQERQVGINDLREVYDLVYDNANRKAIIEEVGKIAFNPSHRWVTYKLVLTKNCVYVTNRQARWLVEYFESKNIPCALVLAKTQ